MSFYTHGAGYPSSVTQNVISVIYQFVITFVLGRTSEKT